MKIRPLAFRNGARNEADTPIGGDLTLSGLRGDVFAKGLTTGPQTAQGPGGPQDIVTPGGPVFSASPAWSLAGGNFTQNWTTSTLITTNDDWSGVPAIVGYRGDNLTSTIGVDLRTLTAHDAAPVVDVNANQTDPAVFNTGGVTEFDLANDTIALAGSGTADAPYFVIYLDSTGRTFVRLQCNLRDLDSSIDDAAQQINIQYRTSPTGTWTNVTGGYFADVTQANAATLVTAVDVTLPADASNSTTLEIRIMSVNAAGNDEWVGVDDIVVSSLAPGAQPGTLSIDDVTLAEGDAGTTAFTFTVTRSGGSDSAISAGWTVTLPGGVGGADASDVTSPLTGTVSFADGVTSQTITVNVSGDISVEPDETFTVTLAAPTGGATLTDATGTGTITNDDVVAPTPGTLAIDDVTLAEGNAGTTAFTFTVTRSGGSAGAVGATWTLVAPGGAGIADVGDFDGAQLFTGTVSFADGDTSETITILVQGDVTVEDLETFNLVLSAATGGATITDDTGLGTITNDDVAPVPGTLSIGDVTLAEGNSGTTAFTFTVTRSGGDDGAVGATWTLDAPGGALLADSADFDPGQLPTGTVSFADGETSKTITILVQGDTAFEDTETFLVTLSAPTGGASLGNANGTGTITNDDAAPAGTLNINDVTLAEGNGTPTTFTFTVTRAGGSAGAVTADYLITAPGGAGNADSADFVSGAVFSGQVSFANGETSKTITIDVEGDTVFEADEAFTVTLSNPTGGAAIGDGTGAGTIQNDDAAPTTGSVSVGDVSITEGNAGTSLLTFTLTRTGGAGAFDVNYATSNGGDPTHAPATAGSDYLAASGTASFGAGVNSVIVQVTINGDLTPELSEEFTLTLSSPTNGATIGDGTAIGLIVTDDVPPASTLIFSENFTGFTAGGFAPNPTAGQIDSDIWRVVGLSDIPNPAYGFTGAAGTDFGRGTITTNDPTTAGVYSVSTNAALVVQPTGAEMEAGGFIEARITNTSGSTATGFDIVFDWAWRNSADRASALEFSYSTDGTTFITVPAANFTTPGALAVGATFTTQNEALTLSGLSVANGGFVYLRWTHVSSTGSGSRDEVGIDNVSVSTTGGAGGPLVSVSDVSVSEATGTMTFTVTRANVAAGAFSVDYQTANGSALAGSDYTATSGTLSFADNQVSATVTVLINNESIPELDETLFLNLLNPVGATISDNQGVGTITNDDGTPIQVSINDVSITEGQAGTSILTFTVTRSGGTGAFDVNFETANDSATAGSDYVANSGTLSFGVGVNTQTISVTINGDLTQEQTERFFVNLSSPTNDAIVIDGQGIGTIVNDEPTFIHDIQGTAYFSPLLASEGISSFNVASANAYTVRAIVTAVDNVGTRQGFYVSEEIVDWDGNSFTSEGIFVMTRNDANVGSVVSGVTVGDLVQFSANVMEYQSFQSMPRTVLINPTGLSVVSSGNVLPTLTLTNMPNTVMSPVSPDYTDSSDGAGDTFDASLYALSYYETVEGMLVTIPNMVVADGFVSTSGGDPFFQAYSQDSANPGQINSRGGYTIAGDPPLAPPDTANPNDTTVNGGQVLHDGDVNPDIIELDFTDFAVSAPAGLVTSASMGDFLGDVTGIIDFDFTDRKLFVTDINSGAFVDSTPSIESTVFGDDSRSLTVATFNVENLDPGDGAARFTAIANAIATNLNAPDIICIEEMQDNNGATASGGADASTTWGMLVSALNAATGKVYQWVDQEPTAGAEGGEPGGNIRVGFLYDTGRVQLGNLDANASLAERRQYTDRIGDGVRDAGDLLAFSDNMLGSEINTTDWAGTRRSLLGEFTFNGNAVYVTANHWPAKGGSGEFWQFDQSGGDPANSDWAQRNAVGQDVYSMMNLIQSTNGDAGIVAGGDFNDFYFYRPLTTVTGHTMADGTARVGGARFDNLTLTLPEAERYTYTFDGRSQAIDHIIVNGLLSGVATYDVVHLNTGFNPTGNPQLSDHEPGIATFDYRNFSEALRGTAGADTIDGFGGNDFIDGGAGADRMIGGTGNDSFRVDQSSDEVIERAGEGTRDVVFAFSNYNLGANAEIEVLSAGSQAGTTALELVGNALNQEIYGNAGANYLQGGGGVDYLIGLGGNDTYFVTGPGDHVVEGAGGGTRDVVYAVANYALEPGAEIEVLSAASQAGTDALSLTGNGFGQEIYGNAGANVLDGGGGADVLIGLGGNDVYFVDSDDYVAESNAGGRDVVYATASHALGAFQEVEVLSTSSSAGTGAIDLTGNNLANELYGNAGANVLDGGGHGDYLMGFGGADTFQFTTALVGGNVDTIADFLSGSDRIALDDAIFAGIGTPGAFNANAFATGAAAGDADDRIIYNNATGQLFYDADGNGAGAAVLFATLQGAPLLTAGDFTVI